MTSYESLDYDLAQASTQPKLVMTICSHTLTITHLRAMLLGFEIDCRTSYIAKSACLWTSE